MVQGQAPVVAGDAEQRVTVPLPRHLKELRREAGTAFKLPPAKLQMWLKGTTLLKEPQQIAAVKDGDLVVIKAEEEAAPISMAGMVSTHKAEFVAHPVQPRFVRKKDEPPIPVGKFEGISEKQSAFIDHPRERPQPVRPKSGGWKPEKAAFAGCSTYKAEFPGHVQKFERRTVVDQFKPNEAPFEAFSSYAADFVKHPAEQFKRAKRVPQRHWIDAPFEGQSSYAEAFTTHEGARPSTPFKGPQNRIIEKMPFEGSSEYALEFYKHELAARVFLEPALQVERPRSAPPRGKTAPRRPFTGASSNGRPFTGASSKASAQLPQP